jgi:hypothetical protein
MENTTPLKAGTFIAIAAAILFGCAWCNEHKDHNADLDAMRESWVKDTVALVKKYNAKDSITKWTMEAKLGDERSARILAEDEAKHYKHLYSVVKTKMSINIPDIRIKYDTIAKHDTLYNDDPNCIQVGTTFNTSTDYYNVSGVLGKDSVSMSVSIPPVELSVTIGDDSKWYQKSHPVVVIKSDNPLVEFKEGNNIVVQPKKGRVWRSIWSHIAAFGAGVVVGKVALP